MKNAGIVVREALVFGNDLMEDAFIQRQVGHRSQQPAIACNNHQFYNNLEFNHSSAAAVPNSPCWTSNRLNPSTKRFGSSQISYNC